MWVQRPNYRFTALSSKRDKTPLTPELCIEKRATVLHLCNQMSLKCHELEQSVLSNMQANRFILFVFVWTFQASKDTDSQHQGLYIGIQLRRNVIFRNCAQRYRFVRKKNCLFVSTFAKPSFSICIDLTPQSPTISKFEKSIKYHNSTVFST